MHTLPPNKPVAWPFPVDQKHIHMHKKRQQAQSCLAGCWAHRSQSNLPSLPDQPHKQWQRRSVLCCYDDTSETRITGGLCICATLLWFEIIILKAPDALAASLPEGRVYVGVVPTDGCSNDGVAVGTQLGVGAVVDCLQVNSRVVVGRCCCVPALQPRLMCMSACQVGTG
jgi:hypothetical protein